LEDLDKICKEDKIEISENSERDYDLYLSSIVMRIVSTNCINIYSSEYECKIKLM